MSESGSGQSGSVANEAARAGAARMLQVAEVIAETHDACSLVFSVPDVDRERFVYRPGQFLTVRIPSERTGAVARCYSIASCAHCGEALKVTVKRTANGYGSNWLCDNVRAGMYLEVLPPTGAFVPKSLDENLLLIAAGSGITPIISILKSALSVGHGQIVLLYANRDERSVIFGGELRRLAAEHPGRLLIIHWLEAIQGLPGSAQLKALVAPFSSHEAFICGPAPFMDAATDALQLAGVPRNRIHIEVFQSLDSDPFAAAAPLPVTSAEGERARLEVELYGETHHLSWPASMTLTQLLLAHEIDAPHLCLEGICGTCACTVARGKVRMTEERPDQATLMEGYVLGCQALPDSDDIRIVF